MATSKPEVISFKVSPEMAEALEGLANRSEFIRNALAAALDSTCPLCRGTGQLSAKQRLHWGQFAKSHQITKCGDCAELHLICNK